MTKKPTVALPAKVAEILAQQNQPQGRQCVMCGKAAQHTELFMNSPVSRDFGICLDCVGDCVRTGHQHIALAHRHSRAQNAMITRVFAAAGSHPPEAAQIVHAEAALRNVPAAAELRFREWLEDLERSCRTVENETTGDEPAP